MKAYTVTGPVVRFGVGDRLGLTIEQADARAYALAEVKPQHRGHVTALVMSLVEFKRGEVVALGRDLTRIEQENLSVQEGSTKTPKKAEPADGGGKGSAGADGAGAAGEGGAEPDAGAGQS